MANGVLLEGHGRLLRKLRRLPQTVQRRVMRPAVSKALTPVNRDAKRRAPRATGLLKKSIGKKVKVYRHSGTVWGAVGVRRGYKARMPDGRYRDPDKYAHLVELGTQHSPAQPFLRPAMDANRERALAILADTVRAGLAKEAAKA
ncbi:MAG: hypothetical protein GY844_12190 [Bradyrhizobium sp.]|nr:hypothetical protein [Bradyrhizobium sp.]